MKSYSSFKKEKKHGSYFEVSAIQASSVTLTISSDIFFFNFNWAVDLNIDLYQKGPKDQKKKILSKTALLSGEREATSISATRLSDVNKKLSFILRNPLQYGF